MKQFAAVLEAASAAFPRWLLPRWLLPFGSAPDSETAGEVSHTRGRTRRHRAALQPPPPGWASGAPVMDSTNPNRTRHQPLPPRLQVLQLYFNCHSFPFLLFLVSLLNCPYRCRGPLAVESATPQPTPFSGITKSPQPSRPHITPTAAAAAITSPPVARLKLLGQRLVEGRGALSRRL